LIQACDKLGKYVPCSPHAVLIVAAASDMIFLNYIDLLAILGCFNVKLLIFLFYFIIIVSSTAFFYKTAGEAPTNVSVYTISERKKYI
jgi:hypothetical protein